MKLKYTRCQVAIDQFDSHIWKQCIQYYSTRYRDFHNKESLRERIAKPLHFVTIEHLSKSGKLNEIGKIFPDLSYLIKYTLVTIISYMIDDVEASRSFQNYRSKMIGVLYCLTLKIISQHLIDSLLPTIQNIIIIYNKD